MKILPLIATLGPLSRTASSKQDLKLDASGSGDPNEPQDNQGHVRFSFKCLTTKKDFCKEHNTTGIVIYGIFTLFVQLKNYY